MRKENRKPLKGSGWHIISGRGRESTSSRYELEKSEMLMLGIVFERVEASLVQKRSSNDYGHMEVSYTLLF